MNDYELSKFVRSCLKKHRYVSEQQAQEVINKIHKKRNTKLRIYFCKQCLGYHLTSTRIKNVNNKS